MLIPVRMSPNGQQPSLPFGILRAGPQYSPLAGKVILVLVHDPYSLPGKLSNIQRRLAPGMTLNLTLSTLHRSPA